MPSLRYSVCTLYSDFYGQPHREWSSRDIEFDDEDKLCDDLSHLQDLEGYDIGWVRDYHKDEDALLLKVHNHLASLEKRKEMERQVLLLQEEELRLQEWFNKVPELINTQIQALLNTQQELKQLNEELAKP